MARGPGLGSMHFKIEFRNVLLKHRKLALTIIIEFRNLLLKHRKLALTIVI